jgi:glycosyltransferase involved in cell wall biosynthesis
LNEIPQAIEMVDTENDIIPLKPFLCFVADGGFAPWNGKSIETSGVGGSETYIIEMARHIQKSGHYQVIVFCNGEEGTFDDVQYRHIKSYIPYLFQPLVGRTKHVCIISRFSEYLPVTYKSEVKTIYFVLHDLYPSGIVIPIHSKLKQIFCLTEWHKEYFIDKFKMLRSLVKTHPYGVDTGEGDTIVKNKYQFIYTSFANRGLLPLLQMWPLIQMIQPMATLHIYTDLNNEWVNTNYPDQIKEIKDLKIKYIRHYSVFWHGWVDKQTLYRAWRQSDIWFYPCIFMETFCLSALEAAISKTFVITNGLAALQNTVHGGLVIPVNDAKDVDTTEWRTRVITEMTPYLHGERLDEKNEWIERNYQWALEQTWEKRAMEMIEFLE